MAFYSDIFNAGNVSGDHYFDAAVLLALGAAAAVKRAEPSGDVCDITIAGRRKAADVLIHRNGRAGPADATKDTVVITIEKLAAFDDAQQDILYRYEQVPPSVNPDNPGRREDVKNPPRDVKIKDSAAEGRR